MSEEEAIKKLQEMIGLCTEKPKHIAYNEQQAIETILDLYQQEKEKNKELEYVTELMAEQLAPLETPTGGVAWTSVGVKDVFLEIAKTRKRILEEE